MGEDADEILPRFHLLFFERPADVIQGHEGMLAITHAENGGVEGQLDRLSFGFESHQLLVARTEGAQSRCAGQDSHDPDHLCCPGVAHATDVWRRC